MEFIAHSHSLLGHSKLVVRAVSSKERKIEERLVLTKISLSPLTLLFIFQVPYIEKYQA